MLDGTGKPRDHQRIVNGGASVSEIILVAQAGEFKKHRSRIRNFPSNDNEGPPSMTPPTLVLRATWYERHIVQSDDASTRSTVHQ